jgi:hypothetical protein
MTGFDLRNARFDVGNSLPLFFQASHSTCKSLETSLLEDITLVGWL